MAKVNALWQDAYEDAWEKRIAGGTDETFLATMRTLGFRQDEAQEELSILLELRNECAETF